MTPSGASFVPPVRVTLHVPAPLPPDEDDDDEDDDDEVPASGRGALASEGRVPLSCGGGDDAPASFGGGGSSSSGGGVKGADEITAPEED